jgi:hypothetical protein
VVNSSHANWTFSKKYDTTSIYKGAQGSRLVVESKMTVTKDKKFTESFLKGVESKKARMLKFIGVTQWNVTKRNIKTINGQVELFFSGSYRNRKGERIYFHENHFYKSKSKIQFLITNKNLKKLNLDMSGDSYSKIKKEHDL